MKKRMKKLASLCLSVSMVFSMFSVPVYASPADNEASEQTETVESTVTEDNAEAPAEEAEAVEETQPQTTTVVETFGTYTVNTSDIDVSDVTPYSVSVEGEVAVDESNPITTTIEEELGDIKVLNEEGESVALTEEQIKQILYMWQQYQKQCTDNANLLGVQQPFFLSYNDNEEDGLGVLGEMLVLAGYTVDDVRSGKYSFDDLMGMIQNFYYADQFGIKYYADDIAAKRDEAIEEVKESGAETMAQKLLVLNDWIAHQATFDMAYIMKGDTDDDGKQDDPLMVAENPQKHQYYDKIYEEMYNVYEPQIRQQFRDKIAEGIKDAVYNQALEQANAAHDDIYAQVYQGLLDSGMEDNKETKAIAEKQTQEQIKKIAEDAVNDVVENGMPVSDDNGNPIKDEEGNQVRVPFETVIDQQMDEEQDLGELGKMKPNDAIPIIAQQAAEGLTQGILGAWEGNHIGILAEGKGVCAGYSKAFSYILQYMSPEIYGKDGAETNMSDAANWKTPEDLYYAEDDNTTLDINKGYIVDMVRITFDAQTTMFGESAPFGEVHFWNAVKVNGTWYYVDPCYADIYVECMNRDRVEIDGTMNHMYFMFSHDTAKEMYEGNMVEDGIASLYKGEGGAHDKSYEDSWFARISSNAYSDGKNFYYLYDSTDQLSMMREFNKMKQDNMDSGDWEALMAGSDPDYKIVYHEITDKDETKGADSDFTTLINFNPKDDDDNTLSAQVYDPSSGEMVDNELLTDLFAKYKEECDIYPSIKLTTALYNGKLYFNLSNCILSYEISSGNVSIVKEYDTVSGKRDNTNPFGGMAFTTCSEDEADFTFTNRPIAAMTIKEDGKMYVSIATNLGFISGKENVNDIPHEDEGDYSSYGYEFEESNYNPNYSTYAQDSDYSDEQLAEMGFSKEINDNDEFMWSAVFVDTINMNNSCSHSSYEKVTVAPFCGRDGFTEERCTSCGAPKADSREETEDSALEHHYVHFEEQYYTKNDSGDWNTGDCYVCTICGFSIEEPTKPKQNQQESDEEFEERKAEYEKEKEIYDHAVETAGHTYEARNAENVTWGEGTASVTGEIHCAVCENKKLDALGANAYDPKAEANAANAVLSATLENPVELTVDEESKTVSGTCDTGLKISCTATGTTKDGKKIVAKKTETKEAEKHDYVAKFTWNAAEEEGAEIPYTATADIQCSACKDEVKGLEAKVALDEENSVAATCEEAGKTVYKATATYTETEGEEPYTFEDSKADEVKATGHDYVGKITWVEKTDEAGNGTGEWDATAVFTCKNNSEHKFEGDAVEVKVEKENKDATCDKAGKVVYTATASVKGDEGKDIESVTDSKEVEVPALGHNYECKFEWSDNKDYTADATAVFTCTNGCGTKYEKDDVEVVVTKVEEESRAATCTEDGQNVYTATATVKGEAGKGIEAVTSEKHAVTIPATGHTYADDAEHAVWTWSEDHKTASLVLTCTVCGTATEAIKAEVEEKSTDATCTEAGTTVYKATAEYEGKTYTAEEKVTGEALGHDYKAEWKWSEAEGEVPHKATLTLTCSRCEDKQTVDGEVKLTSQKAVTCTEDGEDVYTATAAYDGKEYTDTHKDTYKATGHTYADDAEHAVWTWSEDHKEASLVLTCTTCGTATEAIKAEVETKSTDATCTEAGTTVYKATAEYEGKTYTAEEKVTGEALGHDYKEEWKWTKVEGEDGKTSYTASLTLTCNRCDSVVTDLKPEVTVKSDVAATCTEDGETVYAARAEYEGQKYNSEKTVTNKATGHTYADDAEHAVWTWSEDHKEASLVLTCTTCGTATEAIKAEVDAKTTDATCTEAGTTVYTATAKHEGTTYTAQETVTGEALGHDYKTEWSWTEAEGEVPHKATLTLTCSRCKDKQTVNGEVKLTSQKAVTCTEDGEDVYTATATYDGKEYTDTHKDTYKATGHTYADDAEHAVWTWSEATEESETAYVASLVLKCTTCGTPTEAITAKVTEESTDATCTEAGTTVYTAKATHEDKEYTSTKTVTGEALGHNYKSEWKWTKVEGEDGKTSYTADLTLTCDRCGTVVTDIEPVVTVKSDVAATCTEDGETVYVATAEYEGKTYNSEKNVVNKATGHKFGEWEVEIEPDESKEGLEVRTCEVCKAREERSIGKKSNVSVLYKTHIQTYGTEPEWKSNGELSGKTGEAKRLESIRIKLDNNGVYEGGIEYSTHVQREGWQDWKENGAMSGTEGSALRLEAIRIRLTGELAKHYDVYYAVHSQTYGWLNWAKNGEIAGTAGQSKRLEAIKIILVAKGGDAPEKIGTEDRCYVHYYVGYRTHVQTYGWQDYVYDGAMSGTSGESKRLEAINIKLMNQEYDGDIEYQTHVQTYGWEPKWSKNGALSGTSGEGKRLEAIRIRLTDEMAEKYDVYYRVHAQYYGWLGWAKNGEEAGTAGFGKRLEGIEIVLVEKGGKAPGTTEGAFINNN